MPKQPEAAKTKNDQPILVAGGGIGGLAAALGLAQKGYKTLVLERVQELGVRGGDLARAFESYRAKCVHQTTRVQIQSRMIGDHIYHPDGGHAALRNAIMRSMPPEDYYDSLQWLYGGSGLGDGASAVC